MTRGPLEVEALVTRLERSYGEREGTPGGNPVRSLVGTILSQHTNDRNAHAALESLEARFDNWEAVADARLDRLASAIRPAGLHRQKARSIRGALRAIRDARGKVSLDPLRDAPTDEAHAALMALPGVGRKTAACVLLFCLGRPVLPVDTHVLRVSRRLGLLDEGTSAEAAHDRLAALVPENLVYRFHVLLIAHGRARCTARHPACVGCVLEDACPSAHKV